VAIPPSGIVGFSSVRDRRENKLRSSRRFEPKRPELTCAARGSTMRSNELRLWSVFASFILAIFLFTPAVAQETQEGKDWGNYHVNQSLEFGWRGTSFTGNNDVYDTFVNLGQGFRLFNQSLEMRSLNHEGGLFDTLSLSNFGYGGDPNDVTMLRVSKNKWYDFSGTFRRDRNLWNYDLLANPLNPTTSKPTEIITFSPHDMALTRRMSDYNLTLMPQSNFRVRLGYNRNINEGPSLTSYHVGTEELLFQQVKTTTNAYQVGFDYRGVPRTNFSYDQFLNYYKNDTTDTDGFLIYQLSNGQLVDPGVSFDTANSNPCKTPLVAGPPTIPPTYNPACSGETSMLRSQPIRTSYPTEQFSFQSNYFNNVDMAGRLSYTSADARVDDFYEMFQGFESRTLARQLQTTGTAAITRVTSTADYAITWSVTPKFRVVDEFRFDYFRIPGQNDLSSSDLFAASLTTAPVVFNPATCPAPYTAKTCPTHTTSSEDDSGTAVASLYLGQDAKINTFQLEYDFTKRFGARLGYRYGHRIIDQRNVEVDTSTYDPTITTSKGNAWPSTGPCAGQTLNSDGSCTVTSLSTASLANFAASTTINENSLLAGIWARPTDKFRISYDQELFYADNTFTRISPRQLQHYKLRASYKPQQWLSISGTMNLLESRNNVSQIFHIEHTRNAGFNVSAAPNDRFSVDGGYNYTGVFSQTNVCFIFGSGPPPPGYPPCPVVGSPVPLQALSIYNSKLNYGYFNFMVKPVKRVTMRAGYDIDRVTGNTLILNPNSPPGPLNFDYHRPNASVDVDLAKGVTWRTAWGYYDYNEKDSAADPIGPRSFRGNLVNLSVVYSF